MMKARVLHPMVIPSRLLEATRDATEIIVAAKQQAADIKKRAFQEGLAAGMEAARERLADIDRAVDAYWSEREQELVTVALALAHRIVGDLPQDERLAGQVRTALATHRSETALALSAHPEMAAALQSLLQETNASGITIQSDPLLTTGSILLSHSQGQTEIGLVQQFRALLAEPEPQP